MDDQIQPALPSAAERDQIELQKAVLANDLAAMARFIGQLPPEKEAEFIRINQEHERENAALLGGFTALLTGGLRQSSLAAAEPAVQSAFNPLAAIFKI